MMIIYVFTAICRQSAGRQPCSFQRKARLILASLYSNSGRFAQRRNFSGQQAPPAGPRQCHSAGIGNLPMACAFRDYHSNPEDRCHVFKGHAAYLVAQPLPITPCTPCRTFATRELTKRMVRPCSRSQPLMPTTRPVSPGMAVMAEL